MIDEEEEKKKEDLICGVEIDYKGIPIVSQRNKGFGSEIDDFGMGSIENGSGNASPLLPLGGRVKLDGTTV